MSMNPALLNSFASFRIPIAIIYGIGILLVLISFELNDKRTRR